MKNTFDEYFDYMKTEKKISQHTLEAYKGDIDKFTSFLKEKSVHDYSKISKTFIIGYILKLKEDGRASSTILRNVSALRSFCNYLIMKGILDTDPTVGIDIPQGKKNSIEYLSINEIEHLLEQPDDSLKGIRDKAMLEVLYATGIKVSELVNLKIDDVNVRMKFISCNGEHGKPRIIPLGKIATESIAEYLDKCRCNIVKDEAENTFFLNLNGNKLTRQGLWKIIKKYAVKAAIDKEITPKTLRHSFGVHLIQNGADLKSVQELMGHSDISTTQVYADIVKYRIKEVYDKAHPRA